MSLTDGRKYRSNERSYYTQVRGFRTSYAGSTACPSSSRADGPARRSYAQWQAEREGKPTWKTPLQRDVDEAIDRSLTWRQFVREMEGAGLHLPV